MTCPFCSAPDPARLIADLGDFRWIVGDHQFYPGYSLLVAKRHVREVFELDERERHAMSEGMARAARALQRAYAPRKLNYACFGNQVEHLHWHLVPRAAADPKALETPWAHAAEFAGHATTPESARAAVARLRAADGAPFES